MKVTAPFPETKLSCEDFDPVSLTGLYVLFLTYFVSSRFVSLTDAELARIGIK